MLIAAANMFVIAAVVLLRYPNIQAELIVGPGVRTYCYDINIIIINGFLWLICLQSSCPVH